MDTKQYTHNGYIINLGGVEINFEHQYAFYEGSLYLWVSYTEYGERYTDIAGPIKNIKDFYRLVHRDAQDYKLPVLKEMQKYGLCTTDDVEEYSKREKLGYIKEWLQRKGNGDDDDVLALLKETITNAEEKKKQLIIEEEEQEIIDRNKDVLYVDIKQKEHNEDHMNY